MTESAEDYKPAPTNDADATMIAPPADESLTASRADLLQQAGDLLRAPDILERVRGALQRAGFAGTTFVVELLFLIATARLLKHPVSAILRGPSSAGKSYTIKQALAFIPEEEQIVLTAMSAKALLYMERDFRHKLLVIYEAAGMSGDFKAYAIRSLLSEGCLAYSVTDFKRRRTVEIAKDGPTGLISSTAGPVDYEVGTRVLSPNIADTRELTRAIVVSQALGVMNDVTAPDYGPYHALQRLLAIDTPDVRIPFAAQIAAVVDDRAVRLRRDFPALLSLVQAHALLHQHFRQRDADGSVIAKIQDYAAVYRLVCELISEGAERSVPASVRETVQAVFECIYRAPGRVELPTGATVHDIAENLGLTRPSASKRLKRALALGYILERQEPGGRKLFVLGDRLPEDVRVLPTPEELT